MNENNRMLAAVFLVGLFLGLGVGAAFEFTVQTINSSTNQTNRTNTSTPLTIDQMYTNAVRDAMVAEQSEIVNNLTAIADTNANLFWNGTGSNETVLVVTWTKYISSYPVNTTVNTTWGDTWVTVVPEMKDFFSNKTFENKTLRAEQLLGLQPNKGYTYFVELWVKPSDLFRPAPDNEINDTTAQLAFPSNVDANYTTWFNDSIIYSYFTKQMPWTRLGYTYDWGNHANEVGLSEFVIRKGAEVSVKSVTPALEYLS